MKWQVCLIYHPFDCDLQEIYSLRQHLLSVISMGNVAMDSRHNQLDWSRLQNTANIIMDKAMQLFVVASLQLCNKGARAASTYHVCAIWLISANHAGSQITYIDQ